MKGRYKRPTSNFGNFSRNSRFLPLGLSISSFGTLISSSANLDFLLWESLFPPFWLKFSLLKFLLMISKLRKIGRGAAIVVLSGHIIFICINFCNLILGLFDSYIELQTCNFVNTSTELIVRRLILREFCSGSVYHYFLYFKLQNLLQKKAEGVDSV